MGCLLKLRFFSATDPQGWVAGTVLTDAGATLDPWPLEEFCPAAELEIQSVCPKALDTQDLNLGPLGYQIWDLKFRYIPDSQDNLR